MVEKMRKQNADAEAARVIARSDAAAENRRKMPTVTAWVDDARNVFGGDVKVVFASEGGVTFGERSPEGIKLSETLVGPWNKKKGGEK